MRRNALVSHLDRSHLSATRTTVLEPPLVVRQHWGANPSARTRSNLPQLTVGRRPLGSGGGGGLGGAVG